MTTKRANKSTGAKPDTLTRAVEKGFAALAEDIATVKEQVTNLPTKEDVRQIVREMTQPEFQAIRDELRDIRQRLDALEERSDMQTGYAKEIDTLLKRVSVIEKHLGIKA